MLVKEHPDKGVHRLRMDGEWDLLDFSRFGRVYVHVYSFLYAVNFGIDEKAPDPRTIRAFEKYPWKGGWSSLNFYES